MDVDKMIFLHNIMYIYLDLYPVLQYNFTVTVNTLITKPITILDDKITLLNQHLQQNEDLKLQK